VGVRRIQLDRDEWLRATATLRRWVFFWRGVARPPEAEESLAALLSRRDHVRATQTFAGAEPRPDLFQPEQPPPLPAAETPPARLPQAPVAPAAEPPTAVSGEAPASTASRLLEAKRRARNRRE
jgi:hypothetical protein